ncbi:uncharacterized protein [Narcine bancroftii]|uniref:uncharacterized protein n=1 Tax=Narcine bancroftii TaxID=1343680 RepID=UPI003831C9BC
MLQQWVDHQWWLLAFFSKHIRPPELKYSAFDHELLAMYLAIRHFWCILKDRVLTAYRDHKLLGKVWNPWSVRPFIHLSYFSYISESTMDIRHVAGKSDLVPDALSRPTIFKVTGASTQLSSPGTRLKMLTHRHTIPPSPAYKLKSLHWTQEAQHSCVISLQATLGQSCPQPGDSKYSIKYMDSLILPSSQQCASYRTGLYGMGIGTKFPFGQKPVYNASEPKSISTLKAQCNVSCLRWTGLTTCTWTL